MGIITSKEKNISIPSTVYCVVYLVPGTGTGIETTKATGIGTGIGNGKGSELKKQIQVSPISKIQVSPIIKPISANQITSSPIHPTSLNLSSIQSSPVTGIAFQFDRETEEEDLGNSILHEACLFGQLQSVQTLVRDGHNVDCINDNRATPLHLACLKGHLSIVQHLVEHGANIFAEDSNWSSALHYAAQDGDLELIKFLVEIGNLSPSIINRSGETPEAIARKYHHEEAANYFSFLNSSLTISPRSLPTPLIPHQISPEVEEAQEEPEWESQAEEQEEDELMEEPQAQTIERKAQRDLQSNPFSSFLTQRNQSENKSNEPLRLTSSQTPTLTKPITPPAAAALSDAESDFLGACREGDEDYIHQFIAEGLGNINCCNENGSQAIHFTASTGNLHILQFLLDNGVPVDTLNSNRCTALHFACQHSHTQMIQWLIGVGKSNVYLENTNGLTPIHILCGTENGYDALLWFIETQPDLFLEFLHQDNQGSVFLRPQISLLHIASTSPNPNIFSLLLKHNFNISSKDEKFHLPLHIACNENNLAIVELICSHPKLPDLINATTDDTNITPIFYACLNGYYDIVKYLLKFSPDLMIRNVRGNSCLHVACQSGNIKLVKYLLKKGASLQVTNDNGYWPLDFAIKSENADLVTYLRDIYAMNSVFYQEVTQVCCKNDLEGLMRLVHEGYDVMICINMLGYDDVVSREGETVTISLIHEICRLGHAKLFKYISTLPQFTLDLADRLGRLPLHMICMSSSVLSSPQSQMSILDDLIALGVYLDPPDQTGCTPFIYACQYNNIDLAKKLVHLGCNLYHTGCIYDPKTTVLHIATAYGHFGIVKWLVESGLNIYSLNENENTPIDIAKYEGHNDIYKWYMNEGLEFYQSRLETALLPQILWTLENNFFKFSSSVLTEILLEVEDPKEFLSPIDGSNLLHYSVASGNLELTKQLVSSECNIFHFNHAGHTPYHLACMKGHDSLLEYLRMTCQVKLTLKDRAGNTGLHFACLNGHEEIVKYYCHYGMVNMTNHNGESPLHLACQAGFTEIVKILLQNDVKLTVVTNEEMTALHLACYYQWDEIIVLLIRTKKYDLETTDNNQMTPISLIHLMRCQSLNDFLEVVLSGVEIYPPYHPPKFLKNRGKRLRLLNEIHSESESEENRSTQSREDSERFNPSCSAQSIQQTSSIPIPLDGIFSVSSLFFCISDTAASMKTSTLSDNHFDHHQQPYPLSQRTQHSREPPQPGDDSDRGDSVRSGEKNTEERGENGEDFNQGDSTHSQVNGSRQESVASEHHEDFLYLHKIFFEAVNNNNFELFQEIYEENHNIIDINYQNQTKDNIFHQFAKNNQLEMLKYIVDNPFETISFDQFIEGINSLNASSLTPLSIACNDQSNDFVLYLLLDCPIPVDINIPNEDQVTAFTILIQKKNLGVLKEIEQWYLHHKTNTKLQLDLSFLTQDQLSYYHHAVLTKSFEIIEIITNLYKLFLHSSTHSTNFLSNVDCDGKSPFHYACQHCSFQIITYLLSNGADVSLLDGDDSPPVAYAVMAGNMKVVQLLLEKYKNIESVNKFGDGLLHIACQNGRLVIAKWLVSKGLSMKLQNKNGITPIQCSEECQNRGVIEWAKTFL